MESHISDLWLGWLAGLVEGEGCIHIQDGSYPRLSVQMTDRDVVERAQAVTGMGKVRGPYYPSRSGKAVWRWLVNLRPEVDAILLSIYPLMGKRRQAKIADALKWSPIPRVRATHCLRGHPFSGANLYVPPGDPNKRMCRACLRIRDNQRKTRARLRNEATR